MQTGFFFIYTETSLHAGTGSTVSVVDLPIQRERSTGYPLVQGTGVKGALRSQAGDASSHKLIFGPDTTGSSEHAGAVSVGDARIVLFPVRSLAGIFAYVTCPHVLARLRRDLHHAGLDDGFPNIPQVNDGKALVTGKNTVSASGKIVLEEFSYTPEPHDAADSVAGWLAENALPKTKAYQFWREKIQNSLVILSDDEFREFASNSTEIVTRVRLDPATKTVAKGALWTQERLPSDALLVSTVISRSTRDEDGTASAEQVHQWLAENIPTRLQLGGDETTGSGFVAARYI